MSKLDEGATDYHTNSAGHNPCALESIAISLKRIADMMERNILEYSSETSGKPLGSLPGWI